MADYADAIGAKLAKVDPAHAADYRSGPPHCAADSRRWTVTTQPG